MLLTALVLLPHTTSALANRLGVEMMLLSSHLTPETYELGKQYPNKLDRQGKHVFTPGMDLNYEWELDTPWLGASRLHFGSGVFLDSMASRAGYLVFGPRWHTELNPRWDVALYIGPGLYFRESWNRIRDYGNDPFWNESTWFLPGYEYKLFPGGRVELVYKFTSGTEGIWSVVPAYPYVVVQFLGARWPL